MTLADNKNYIFIFFSVLIVIISYLIAEFIITGHQFGFPLDDAWIHIRYSENMAKGYFFHYNIGEPTPGTTSPLWTFILAIPFLISQDIYLQFTLFAGSLFFLLACFEVYKISLLIGLSKNVSLFAAILTVIAGRLIWAALSGMEITLFCYLILLVTRYHIIEIESGKITVVTGLLLGLSVIARPESYLFASLYYLITIILFWEKIKTSPRSLIFSLILFLIIVIPYPLFCYFTTGGFLPNTFKVQNTSIKPSLSYFKEAGYMFAKDNLLIVILVLAEVYYFIDTIVTKNINKKTLLINLWIILLPIVSAFIAPNLHHQGRYLMPLIPFINISVVFIIANRLGYLKAKNAKRYRYHFVLIAVIVLSVSLISTAGFSKTLGRDTYHINTQHVRMANWLNANLPNEKCFGINDIGAIAFITKRKIFDMEGLVNPEIFKIKKLPDSTKALEMMKLLRNNNVNYIVIYPAWYPGLMEIYSQNFEKVFSAGIEENTFIPEYEMYVFKINWDKINLN
jgi:hypothetical protein